MEYDKMSNDTNNIQRTHNTEELIERAKKIYSDLQARENIERDYKGKYIAIDVDSERYFIRDTRDEAVHAAKTDLPNAMFFVKRIAGVDTVARNYPFTPPRKTMHARLL